MPWYGSVSLVGALRVATVPPTILRPPISAAGPKMPKPSVAVKMKVTPVPMRVDVPDV